MLRRMKMCGVHSPFFPATVVYLVCNYFAYIFFALRRFTIYILHVLQLPYPLILLNSFRFGRNGSKRIYFDNFCFVVQFYFRCTRYIVGAIAALSLASSVDAVCVWFLYAFLCNDNFAVPFFLSVCFCLCCCCLCRLFCFCFWIIVITGSYSCYFPSLYCTTKVIIYSTVCVINNARKQSNITKEK